MNKAILPLAFALLVASALPAVADDESALAPLTATHFSAATGAVDIVDQVTPDIKTMYVAPDGTCYTYSSFGVADVYKAGKFIGSCSSEGVVPDGAAVTGNGKYVYLSCKSATDNTFGIYRVHPDGTVATYGAIDKNGNPVDRTYMPTGNKPVLGLAASDAYVYVTVPEENIVRVFDAETLAPVSWFAVDQPEHIVTDAVGQIWVEQLGDATKPGQIVCFDPTGTKQPRTITLAPTVQVSALAMDTGRNRLILADAGDDQNIKIYDLGKLQGSPTSPWKSLGKPGGIFAKRRGQVDPLKLNGPCGAGIDDTGNVYVASNGSGMHDGSSLKCYTLASGNVQWKLVGLIDSDSADFDPAIDTDLYTLDKHFLYNYAKPNGQGWVYNGYTLDRLAYPDDPRIVFEGSRKSVWVRHTNGRPYLFVGNADDGFLAVYRFRKNGPEGEIAVPAVVFVKQPDTDASWPPSPSLGGKAPKSSWRIWRDNDGDGKFGPTENAKIDDIASYGKATTIDSTGTIWFADEHSISKLALHDFDGKGVPYFNTHLETWKAPAPLATIDALQYDAASDAMYLGGTADSKDNVLLRIDDWSKGNRTPRWKLAVTNAGTAFAGNQITLFRGGRLAFVTEPPKRADGSSGPMTVNLVETKSGEIADQMNVPANPDDDAPINRDRALRITRRKSGELVLVDGTHAQKLTIYRTSAIPKATSAAGAKPATDSPKRKQ